MVEEEINILFKNKDCKDVYDEDEFGNETHTLDCKSTVEIREYDDIEKAKEDIDSCHERAADNPPYADCEVILAWYKKIKEIISKRVFEEENHEKTRSLD